MNTSNAVVAEYSFDAWGRRRNAANWSYTLDGNDKALFADRGFTGHEYLPWYKLYNMNGRLYDPAVGRFLSADPVVQDPGNSQSYNRYSYCLNNPLKYTDPSGYILEQQDLPPDPEQSVGGAEFYRKFSGSNSGNGWIDGWYTAYRQALNKGYTGDLVKFIGVYDKQVFSTNFNGTLTYSYYTYSDRVDKDGAFTLVGKRHDITINFAGQGDVLGLMKDIGTGADYASGVIGLTQIGMLEYRMSLPLSSKIGTLSYFSTTYRGLGVASKSLGFVGYAGGLSSVYLDYKSLQSGEIGLGRFGYRTGSLGLSIYTGAAIGGPWGAVGGAAVGGISVGCEYTYDNVLHPLWREVNYQIWNFENALKNGWYPGR